MNGTAHCADMYPENALDVPDLVAARVLQRQYLSKWLSLSESDKTTENNNSDSFTHDIGIALTQ